jgi:hypothetical protein
MNHARGIEYLFELLKTTHDTLYEQVMDTPITVKDVEAMHLVVSACASVLNEVALHIKLLDSSPRADEFWKKNMPPEHRERLDRCNAWIKMLRAAFTI